MIDVSASLAVIKRFGLYAEVKSLVGDYCGEEISVDLLYLLPSGNLPINPLYGLSGFFSARDLNTPVFFLSPFIPFLEEPRANLLWLLDCPSSTFFDRWSDSLLTWHHPPQFCLSWTSIIVFSSKSQDLPYLDIFLPVIFRSLILTMICNRKLAKYIRNVTAVLNKPPLPLLILKKRNEIFCSVCFCSLHPGYGSLLYSSLSNKTFVFPENVKFERPLQNNNWQKSS